MSSQIPINIVGGNSFGRYKKISDEKTINMFVSDGALVSFAGYKKVIEFVGNSDGRALYHSVRGQFLLAVIGGSIYRIEKSFLVTKITGSLSDGVTEVYIDENLASQICIVDGTDAYIYNWRETPNVIYPQNLLTRDGITPSYVSYHNTFFLISGSINDANPQNWYAYITTKGSISAIEMVGGISRVGGQFSIQTKSDFCMGAHRLPGRANHVLVLGSIVCEVWTQLGGEENYRRNSSFNIDSGCVSRESIAASEEFVCWLAQNESSQRTIMVTNGSEVKPLSTAGIDHLLSKVEYPSRSTAFFFRQDGHLFYQLTFYDEVDPFTLAYDFNNQEFYYLTDHCMNNHPARHMAFFNDELYFISIKNGSLYETSTDIVQAIDTLGDTVGAQIPRIRICNTIRLPEGKVFRARRFSFVLEQGYNDYYIMEPQIFGQVVDENGTTLVTEGGALILPEDGYVTGGSGGSNNIPTIEMSISKNGCATFSNDVSRVLNTEGKYKNIISWDNMGFANEFTIMLRFNGLQRFVVMDGLLEVSE